MKIKNSMKTEVVSVRSGTRLKDAAALMVEKRVGTLPVVDTDKKLLGTLAMRDILGLFLPDFLRLLEDVDFIKDYGALETPSPEEIQRAQNILVDEIMEEAIAVEEEAELIRAFSIMEKHTLTDLPVVRGGKLVGIVSRVDIGRRFLENLGKR